MNSKLNLKIYRGKLVEISPNLNKNCFPTVQQINQIFNNKKSTLTKILRLTIENTETLTQYTFQLPHAKAIGIATDNDVKNLHVGALVQVQSYYNQENDLNTAIGMQAYDPKYKIHINNGDNQNASEIALQKVAKAEQSQARSNAFMTSLVAQSASQSIAGVSSQAITKELNKINELRMASAVNNQAQGMKPRVEHQEPVNKNTIRASMSSMRSKHNSATSTYNNTSSKRSEESLQKAIIHSNSISKSSIKSQANQDYKENISKNDNQQKGSLSMDSQSDNGVTTSDYSSVSSSSINMASASQVISSAQRQVQEAGYTVPNFAHQDSMNLDTASKESNANNRDSNSINSNIQSAQKKRTLNNSASVGDNKDINKKSSSSVAGVASESSIVASSVNSEQAIQSIATKYGVPKSMAAVKYKIQQQSLSEAKRKSQESARSHRARQASNKVTTNEISKASIQSTSMKSNDNQAHPKVLNKKLERLQEKENNQSIKDKSRLKNVKRNANQNKLPDLQLSQHDKEIQNAYNKILSNKNLTTAQLNDKLRDIYRYEGWNQFFKKDNKEFISKMNEDLDRILKNEGVKYPLSYNNIPNVNIFQKILEIQKHKGDK